MPDDLEERMLELLNLFVTFVSFSRQDGALAVADEALSIAREADSAKWQFAFLLYLCDLFDPEQFPADFRQYTYELFGLVTDRADELLEEPEHRYIGPALDAMLERLPSADRLILAGRFSSVKARYYEDYRAEMAHEPSTATPLPQEVLAKYRILSVAAAENSGGADSILSAPLAEIHSSLCEAIKGLVLSRGERHHLLAEVHYITMQAGIRWNQRKPLKEGAAALFKQPRFNHRQADRVRASLALMSLWNEEIRQLGPRASEVSDSYNSPQFRAVRKFILGYMEDLFKHRLVRFMASSLHQFYPLIASYVDYLSERPETKRQAARLISVFQGGLTSVAYGLRDDQGLRPGDFDFFAFELDNLLHYQSLDIEASQEEAAIPDGIPYPGIRHGRQNRDADIAVGRMEVEDYRSYSGLSFQNTAVDEDFPLPASIIDLHAELEHSEAVITFFASEQWVYAGAICGKLKKIFLERVCDRSEVIRRSISLSAHLRSGVERFLLDRSELAWLHEFLVGPAVAMLPKSIERIVFIAPQLHLPLHLSYDDSRGRYLLEDYCITYAHSAHLYREALKSRRTSSGRALIVDGSTGGANTLKNVEGELAVVRRALQQKFQVDGPVQLRDDVLRPRQKVTVLHYAGHMDTMESGTSWNLRLSDGRVSPGELLGNVDRSAEIVSLFSCFSADQLGGSLEPIGISVILAAAGVRTFIGCQWAIPDQVAAAIAADLYSAWSKESLSLPDATRKAMLRWRTWPPAVWGSVVCYGPFHGA